MRGRSGWRDGGASRVGALLAAAALLCANAAPARAEGAAATAAGDAPAEEAKKLFAEGVAAFTAKDYKRAHELLRGAFAKRKHYKIAVNLGATELELGKPRDAAEHLAFAIAELEKSGKAQPADLAEIRGLFSRAQREVVTVKMAVTMFGEPRPDATASVDGAPLERHGDSVFLAAPGGTLRAAVPSAEATFAVQAAKGQSVAAKLELRPAGTAGALVLERASAAAVPVASGADGRPDWPFFLGLALSVGAGVTAISTGVFAISESGAAGDLEASISAASKRPATATCADSAGTLTGDCNAFYLASGHSHEFSAVAAGTGAAAAVGLALSLVYRHASTGGESAPSVAIPVFEPSVAVAPGAVFFGARGSF